MTSLYGLVWRSLRAHRTRTLLSLLAVALGVAATIAVSIVGQSGRAGMLKSDEMRVLMEGMLRQFDPMLNFISLAVLLVVGFLIFNTFAMSVTQRRQQIGALRSLGLTRGQVRRLLLAEALVIGVSGTLVGAVIGPLLGKLLIGIMKLLFQGMLVLDDAPPAASSFALAVTMGIGVTLLAVLLPARRAMQVSPLAALHAHEAAEIDRFSHRRAVAALLFMAVLLVWLVAAPPGDWVTAPLDLWLAVALVGGWLVALALLLPSLIGITGQALRPLLARRFQAVGRLIADNIQRGRSRVTLTIGTLALALLIVTGLTGFMEFVFKALFLSALQTLTEQNFLYVGRFDPADGWTAIQAMQLGSLALAPEDIAAVNDAAGTTPATPMYYLVSPELSFFGDAYFSFMFDPDTLYRMGSALFTFTEGSWETALPVMRAGCGVLLMPLVAAKNQVGVGDSLTVTHAGQTAECTVAGIGKNTTGASIVSLAAQPDFPEALPFIMLLQPETEAETNRLETTLHDQRPDLAVGRFTVLVGAIGQVVDLITIVLNVMLLLALLAAAMGVVNTTMMSVTERRREIGLLRAVGATRTQMRAALLGEAALMGVVGGLVGLVAGVGLTVIFAVSYGGSAWGYPDLPLWPAALQAAGPALLVGLVGVLAAPVIAALAAWLPARGILRETPVETLALQ